MLLYQLDIDFTTNLLFILSYILVDLFTFVLFI